MLLVFVDETSDSKFKQYFGLNVATINSAHYKHIKDGFQDILRNSRWDESIEFKGSYLFSASKGDPNVGISERIDIAHKILDLNTANKNARMRFDYLRHEAPQKSHGDEYLRCLPLLLSKAIKKITKGSKGKGKDLALISCDHRNDLKGRDIQNAIEPVLRGKGYTLVEEVMTPASSFHTVGILYADIVGYLVARIDTIANDIDLFENIPPDQFQNNGKIKKLKSSVKLIQKIKQLDKYELRRD